MIIYTEADVKSLDHGEIVPETLLTDAPQIFPIFPHVLENSFLVTVSGSPESETKSHITLLSPPKVPGSASFPSIVLNTGEH